MRPLPASRSSHRSSFKGSRRCSRWLSRWRQCPADAALPMTGLVGGGGGGGEATPSQGRDCSHENHAPLSPSAWASAPPHRCPPGQAAAWNVSGSVLLCASPFITVRTAEGNRLVGSSWGTQEPWQESCPWKASGPTPSGGEWGQRFRCSAVRALPVTLRLLGGRRAGARPRVGASNCVRRGDAGAAGVARNINLKDYSNILRDVRKDRLEDGSDFFFSGISQAPALHQPRRKVSANPNWRVGPACVAQTVAQAEWTSCPCRCRSIGRASLGPAGVSEA